MSSGVAGPAEGDLGLHGVQVLLGDELGQERVRREAGRDAVDPHLVRRGLVGRRAAEGEDAGLGGVVGGVARRAAGPRLGRGDVDDRTGPPLDHVGQHGPHGEELAGQADVDDPAPGVGLRLPQQRRLRRPGVVDEDVDPPEVPQDLGHDGVHVCSSVTSSARPTTRRPVSSAMASAARCRALGGEVGEDHVGARLGQPAGGGPADAGAGGGRDEGHAAAQVVAGGMLPS